MALTDKLKSIPAKPGIYRFLNESGKLLYIGKAKNLKNRVRSYFNKSAELTPAKLEMVSKIKKIEFTIVSNETEALLLESNLIKKYQPPFNIVLKDDKSWLYIIITADDFPQVLAVRKNNLLATSYSLPAKFFGPYTSASSVRKTLRLLRKIFPYFTAGGPMVELGKKTGSPYHLGRYLKNRQISKKDWLDNIKLIKRFLKGQTNDIKKQLADKMKQASAKNDFEKAAAIRDQLQAIEKIIVNQKVVSPKNENDDYLGLSLVNNQAVITILKIREGKLLDQLNFTLKNLKNLQASDILGQFIEKYYQQTNDLPKKIYLPIKIDSEFDATCPQKGQKKKLVKLAEENAKNFLENSLASFEKEKNKIDGQLEQLKKILHLKNLPKRIEAYDISNIQGHLATGSMVVLTNGKINKSEYRRFKIKTVKKANDPAMISEVVKRRFKNSWPKPDLMVIDGGIAQVNAAINSLSSSTEGLASAITIISLAKKNEEIYLPGQAVPIKLPKFSSALQLLQLIRDEAHRFAINYHRNLRKKKILK